MLDVFCSKCYRKPAVVLLWIAEVLDFLYRQYQFSELDLMPLGRTFKTAWKLIM
jgi:hypothetical protein